MTHPEHVALQELAAAYALGALSPEEHERFERFLGESPGAQREVAEYRDVTALLALAEPEAAPVEDLRLRILDRIGEGKVTPIARRASRHSWMATAAGLLLAAGLGAGWVAARDEVGRLRLRLDSTATALAGREATLNAIFEPGVQMFQLTASGDPDPGIQLFWDRARNRAILHGFRLRPLDPGKAYQLWFIRDGTPVPSVTFRPEPSGHVKVEEVEVPASGEVSAAAITVEPEIGSLEPTSPIVMVGSLTAS
jgi:anti-sigma-K factor RskA